MCWLLLLPNPVIVVLPSQNSQVLFGDVHLKCTLSKAVSYPVTYVQSSSH